MKPAIHSPAITIRPAYADDQLPLQRLAAIDSAATPPASPLFVAEVDGELRVAVSATDGSAIADPFHPTAAIVELVRSHARLTQSTQIRRKRGRVLPWRSFRQGVGLQRAGAH
jgi:hypothetical protein